MFAKRGFPYGIVFLCVIALGIGFLSGYAGSLMFRNEPVASESAPTPDPAQALASQEPQATGAPIHTLDHSDLPAAAGAEDIPEPTPVITAQPKTVGYLVKEYGGKVAVYQVTDDGESTLSSLTDVEVESLPEADREKLKEGIGVKSEEEMLQLLEDYMS